MPKEVSGVVLELRREPELADAHRVRPGGERPAAGPWARGERILRLPLAISGRSGDRVQGTRLLHLRSGRLGCGGDLVGTKVRLHCALRFPSGTRVSVVHSDARVSIPGRPAPTRCSCSCLPSFTTP